MFKSVPPVRAWSIFAADLTTAVGPCESMPWLGEMPSETGSFAFLPLGSAPVTWPK